MKRKVIKAAAPVLLALTLLGLFPAAVNAASLDGFIKKNEYTYGQFDDVDESRWYGADGHCSVRDAYELGLIVGKSEKSFDPEGPLLLCEAVTLAARVNSIYYGGEGNFDFEGYSYWFIPYVDYAAEHGIIYYEQFGDWFAEATRADMAKIFAHALPEEEFETINETVFVPDVNRSSYAYKEIYSLYRAGVLTGNDGYGSFLPDNSVSRAEAAAIITRVAVRSKRLISDFEEPESYIKGYSNKELVDLYLMTALSGEYEGNRGYTVKWGNEIKYYIVDGSEDTYTEHISSLCEKLNSVKGFPGISRTYDRDSANLEIYFIPSDDFNTVISDVPANSWGYAQIWWDGQRNIYSGKILIDNEESDESARKSVISEELLQSLGLLYDNEDYPESIFYQWSNQIVWPSEIDWLIVSLLYDPEVPAGSIYQVAESAAYAYIDR